MCDAERGRWFEFQDFCDDQLEKDTKPCGSPRLPSGISLFPARMLTGLRKLS